MAVAKELYTNEIVIDNTSITKNTDNEIQAVGLIDNNGLYTTDDLIQALTIYEVI